MRHRYLRIMDKLYAACIVVPVVCIVCMTALIFTGVVMRYVFSMGASFAEPMAIFFTVQLTMYGAAACYRDRAHLRLTAFVKLLPRPTHRVMDQAVNALMIAVAVAMVYYGFNLSRTTWFQSYPEWEYIRVGVVYSAFAGSGAVMLLFAIEAIFFPDAVVSADERELQRAIAQAEEEERHAAS